jgi:DNA repair exonuclease SbcCD ATPase subunit
MAEGPTSLKRGFFGYSRRSVLQTLLDRDVLFGRTQQRLQTAEAELSRTRAIVEALRAELGDRTRAAKEEEARLTGELEEARARVDQATAEARSLAQQLAELEVEAEELRVELTRLETEASSDEERPGTGFASQALARVLETTEHAVAGLFERARRGNEQQLQEMERARESLREQTEGLTRWREEIAMVIRSVGESAAFARSEIEQAPARLREALDPTTNAMTSMTAWLDELGRVTGRLDQTAGPESAPNVVHLGEAAEPSGPEGSGNNGSFPDDADDSVDEGLPSHYRWQ